MADTKEQGLPEALITLIRDGDGVLPVWLNPPSHGRPPAKTNFCTIEAAIAFRDAALASDAGERGVVDVAALIVRDVAELPDRNSPEDAPEMMLVSADELREIVLRHAALRAQPAGGGVCVYCDAYNASVQEAAPDQPDGVDRD